MNKNVSIIIPTYRPKDYLYECLGSILRQSLKIEKYEVIIVLNGIKEPYFTEIKNYIENNKLINFILKYTEISGVSIARNLGIETSSRNYVCFLDDDDFISNNYLETLLREVEEESIVLSNNYYFLDNENKEHISDDKSRCYIEKLKTSNINKFRKYFSGACGKIFPKKVIKDIMFNTKYKNGEDSLFMLEISKNIKFIKTTNKDVLYYRRIRKNSAFYGNKKRCEILINEFKLIQEYSKFFFRIGYDKYFILLRILAVIKGIVFSLKRRN